MAIAMGQINNICGTTHIRPVRDALIAYYHMLSAVTVGIRRSYFFLQSFGIALAGPFAVSSPPRSRRPRLAF